MSKYHVRYTNEQLIEQIQSYVLIHGKLPTSSIVNDPNSNMATTSTFRSAFGSFNNAIVAAGFEPAHIDGPSSIHQCSQCGKEVRINNHTYIKSLTKRFFCSQSCATTYNNLNRPRKIKPLKPKSINRICSKAPHTKIYGPYICTNCKIPFWATKMGQKCCSLRCRDHKRASNASMIIRIPYFNIHTNTPEILQSSWEVKIAEWLDLHNIYWEHPHKRINWYDTTLQKHRTYLPDFHLPHYNIYLDVKNPSSHEQNFDKYTQLQHLLPLYIGNVEYIQQSITPLMGLT